MRKFKIFWNMEEEEAYLNQKAAEGHILEHYSASGVYHFKDGAPQNLNYRIDYRTFKSKRDFEDYLTLFEDAGWKHISGDRWNGSQYFLPINEQAGEEIFSDSASAAERYKTLYSLCCMNIAIFTVYVVIMLTSGNIQWSTFGFLTPGLWERTGFAFWKAFCIELPFVILRIGCPIFFMVLSGFYGYWGCRAKKAYEEAKAFTGNK